MFKHDFVYSIYEDFIDIDKQIKNKIKKIKVTKFDENRNNFNSKNKMNPLLLDSVNTYLKKIPIYFIFTRRKYVNTRKIHEGI